MRQWISLVAARPLAIAMLPLGMSLLLLLALLSGPTDAAAARCAAMRMMGTPFEGATGRASSTRRIWSRANSNGRVATAEADDSAAGASPVVSETTTFGTVSDLNQLSLSKFRCHSLLSDPPPDIDPFALVKDEIALLNGDVCEQVEATDEVLSASAQHFFGTGNTREGKRVRPVLVCLMGEVSMLLPHPTLFCRAPHTLARSRRARRLPRLCSRPPFSPPASRARSSSTPSLSTVASPRSRR